MMVDSGYRYPINTNHHGVSGMGLIKNHNLMQLARNAKRNGMPVSVITKGLKPEFQKFIPEIEAEYDRFKPRKRA